MARAYIVPARNDLGVTTGQQNPLLQVLDLWPNTSHRNYAIDGPGQTAYYPWMTQNDVVVLLGAGPIVTVGVDYGLQAYLVDRVQNRTGGAGNLALIAAELVTISGLITAAVAAGTPLTLALINVMINTPAGVGGSDLDGTLGTSTGAVEDILRILAGEVYRLPTGSQVADAAPNFDITQRGNWVILPDVLQVDSVYTAAGLPVRGNNPFSGKVVPTDIPVQTGLHDTNFRDIRGITDTGHLHRSALDGALSHLIPATYTWLNEEFTYGAGGTALDITGTVIPATGVFRAVVVYDVLGNVI